MAHGPPAPKDVSFLPICGQLAGKRGAEPQLHQVWGAPGQCRGRRHKMDCEAGKGIERREGADFPAPLYLGIVLTEFL